MPVDLSDPENLARRLGPLLERQRASLDSVDIDEALLRELGFEVAGGEVRVPSDIERLDAHAIHAALSERARSWIEELVALDVAGSTSTVLNELAASRSVHGLVRLAELQLQGRGRRGRGWISPYANNLALSLGARLPQTPDLMGGFSLCIGLAVADHLQSLGIEGVELKWPNDVLIRGRKVAGVLIELHRAQSGTEVVIGVGINFRLPGAARATIDQPVTDLAETGQRFSRNLVAGGLLSSLVDFIEGFAENGFAPMRPTFDQLHRFHQQSCILLMGTDKLEGSVRGVSERGELLMELDGRIEAFNSGEVSLRPA